MNDDLQVRQEVIDAFGVDSYTVSGRLNTGYLAKEIFSDTEHVKRINAIVHPRVLAAFSSAVEMARRDGVGLMVMEAALIYESGADELLDYIVVVDAPADARIARVADRDDASREEVAARMRRQLDPEELARRADFVIRNDGSLDDLRNKVAVMVGKVLGPPPRGGG